MINILEELSNGNLHPNDRYYKKNSKFSRAEKKVVEAESALMAALCETDKKLLEDFEKAQDEVNYLSRTDKFIYGYRLGTLAMMEVFRASDDFVTSGADD